MAFHSRMRKSEKYRRGRSKENNSVKIPRRGMRRVWYILSPKEILEVCLIIVAVMALLVIPATIGEWDVWKSQELGSALTIAGIVIYVLVRIAILAVKIFVPYFIIRFLIHRFGWSRRLYALVAVAALLAIATDGSSFRRNYREDPELAAEMAKLHAETEFEKYRIVQDQIYISDFDELILNAKKIEKLDDEK